MSARQAWDAVERWEAAHTALLTVRALPAPEQASMPYVQVGHLTQRKDQHKGPGSCTVSKRPSPHPLKHIQGAAQDRRMSARPRRRAAA